MAKINPAKFMSEVRQEMNKVTWPTRKETTTFTTMVLALVAIAATFFVFVDWVLSTTIRAVLGL